MITARRFLHPVSIARQIMDKSPHCALSGEGALKFAQNLDNFDEICAPEDLKGDYPLQKIRVTSSDFNAFARYTYEGRSMNERDSVGAVAMDKNGHLACANSTGLYSRTTIFITSRFVLSIDRTKIIHYFVTHY